MCYELKYLHMIPCYYPQLQLSSLLLPPLLLSVTTFAWSAEKIDMSQQQSLPVQSTARTLSPQALTGMKVKNQITLPNGRILIRYQQFYKGVPVWNESIARQDNLATRFVGHYIANIDQDLSDITPAWSPEQILQRAKSLVHADNTSMESAKLYVRLDQNNSAKLMYLVSFIQATPVLHRPGFIMDAQSGEVLKQWDELESLVQNHRPAFNDSTAGASALTGQMGFSVTDGKLSQIAAYGPGGNVKTGKRYYGKDQGLVPLTVTKVSDTTCMLSNEFASIVDAHQEGRMDTFTPFIRNIYQFTCPNSEDPSQEVNGGYSPLNDASYTSEKVERMYDDWFKTRSQPQKPIIQVHYARQMENAFWIDGFLALGDGQEHFYPLSAMDVMGHELAHGFTNYHSGLIYDEQSGGINEAYSDMAGEAVKYYATGHNDFLVGADIVKSPLLFLRDMKNPPADGRSIDTVEKYQQYFKKYHKAIDVHLSSGIYNKAFYLLSTTPGWNTRKSFEVFTYANAIYWQPEENLNSAVCGVQHAADNLGYTVADVTKAFQQVGARCIPL
ncbi:MAG: M4 family metallopeptidase [Enterobacteriaceae bacterium]